jgi:hypothetical protein
MPKQQEAQSFSRNSLSVLDLARNTMCQAFFFNRFCGQFVCTKVLQVHKSASVAQVSVVEKCSGRSSRKCNCYSVLASKDITCAAANGGGWNGLTHGNKGLIGSFDEA